MQESGKMVKLTGRNTDYVEGSVGKKIIEAGAIIIIGLLLLLPRRMAPSDFIKIGPTITNIIFMIGFFVFVLLMSLKNRSKRRIVEIILKSNQIRLYLQQESMVYSIKDVKLKYTIVHHKNEKHIITDRSYYIHIDFKGKVKEYNILSPRIEDKDFKAFIIYANLLARNDGLENITEEEIEYVIANSVGS